MRSTEKKAQGPGARLQVWAAGISLALVGGVGLGAGLAGRSLAAGGPAASARSLVINGQPIGEVDVNGKPVLRIRAASGGYSPVQRAQVVANRLNQISSNGQLGAISTGVMNGEYVVLIGGQEVVTASKESAAENSTAPSQLARSWAQNLQSALGVRQAASSPEYTYNGSTQYAASRPDQHYADKLVPIVSVGTGARVGGALVTGPSSQVAKVAAVGQIEGRFQNVVEGRLLVPASNPRVTEGLQRVPETSVYAVVDYRLP